MTAINLSESDRAWLLDAAAWKFSGLDLRYEGGPWIGELDRLCDRGLLACSIHGPDYMVGYVLTEAGKAALEDI